VFVLSKSGARKAWKTRIATGQDKYSPETDACVDSARRRWSVGATTSARTDSTSISAGTSARMWGDSSCRVSTAPASGSTSSGEMITHAHLSALEMRTQKRLGEMHETLNKILQQMPEMLGPSRKPTPTSAHGASVDSVIEEAKEDAAARMRKHGTLTVNIMKANNLIKADLLGLSDPYVHVGLPGLPGQPTKLTRTIRSNLNPEWDERIEFEGVLEQFVSSTCRLDLFDQDFRMSDAMRHGSSKQNILSDDKLGWLEFSLSELGTKDSILKNDCELSGVPHGTITFEVSWSPDSNAGVNTVRGPHCRTRSRVTQSPGPSQHAPLLTPSPLPRRRNPSAPSADSLAGRKGQRCEIPITQLAPCHERPSRERSPKGCAWNAANDDTESVTYAVYTRLTSRRRAAKAIHQNVCFAPAGVVAPPPPLQSALRAFTPWLTFCSHAPWPALPVRSVRPSRTNPTFAGPARCAPPSVDP